MARIGLDAGFILVLLALTHSGTFGARVHRTSDFSSGSDRLEEISATRWWTDDLATVNQSTLDKSPEFTGDSAYNALCTFWKDRVRSRQYNKAGCVSDCSTLTIDCNTGDDDGIIDITYYRSKLWFSSMTTKYGIYKKHKSVKGRYMLFKYHGARMQNGISTGGTMGIEGCPDWMRHSDSWCEGPKWTKREENNMQTDSASWEMTYVWLQWDTDKGEYVLEEDVVGGSKEVDEVEVKGMRLNDLGTGVGTMGPIVQDWYTVGVNGWTEACLDNDKPKGTDLPVIEDKKCDIDVWKVFPGRGDIVKTTWHTYHTATRQKKRFA